jgi:CBS-domain-containing membrane protein
VALSGGWLLGGTDNLFLIGSLGASAVLVYGAPRSPLAQPRNLVGGHMLSALVGVLCFQLLPPVPGLAEAIAVASAIALMHLTRTLHPPGGATALIAVIGSDELHALGYLYVLAPAGLGAVILLIVALLVNNACATRRYPEFWL